MKNELADAGEDTTGMAKSTAKLRDSLIQLGGVDILADGGKEFKSTYEIMSELAKNWDSISDMGKASIIEQVAGKRGASFFSSMMTNWKDAEDAYAAALNSAGSAEKENQAYLNSIAGKQAQFKSAFESLSNDFLKSDMVKFGIDAGRHFVQGVDGAINATGGGMGTVFATAGLIATGKFTKSVVDGFVKTQGADSIFDALATLGTKETIAGLGGAFKASTLISSLSGLAHVIMGIGGAALVAYGAYKDWDDATDTITESQNKLNNSLTNYKSAQNQIANIDKQIQTNESEINDIRDRGISSIKDSSRLEQLTAENNQLKTQKQYQSAIADAEYNVSAASARAAMNNQDAYSRMTKNGKVTYGKSDRSIFSKMSLAFDEMLGWSDTAQNQGYYLSQGEYLDALTGDYIKSRENLNELMSSKDAANKIKEIEAAQQEYSDNAKEFQLGLSDYYGYLEALTNPETGRAKKGFEQEYKDARNQINKMLRADQGDSRFIESLLGYGEYAELQSQLTDMALNNGFTDGWENSSQAMRDFVSEAESAGMKNAADSIESIFRSIGTDNTKSAMSALAIIEDNLQTVTDGVSDFETKIANSSKAAQEGFSSTGLSFAAQATLGSKYESAMMKTANGLRLSYAEYQKTKSEAISSQMASYAKDIKQQQDIGSGLLNQYSDLEKKINSIKNAPDAAFGSDSERASKLANYQQQLAAIGSAIQTVRGNIRTLGDAQVELTGFGSKLNTYLDTTSGAFEDTRNIDAIGDSFAKVKEDFTDGWTSGAQARAFTDLWTYEDMTKASNQEVSASFEEAEANMGRFYDMVSKTAQDGTTTWKAFKNGSKIVDELSGAQEKLGKSFMDADKNIKLTTSDVANIAKVWGISESAATELLQALNSYGYTVDITNNGKSFEQIEENAAGAQAALDKYSDGLIASKDLYDDYEESMERSRNVGAYDSTAERHYKQEAEAKKQLIEAEDRLQKLQDAREAASEDAARTGDYSASNALEAELVKTAQYQAQLKHRNELENNLMNFDTSSVKGDFKNRIEMLQEAQRAVEDLQTAQTVDQYAPGLLGPDAVRKAEGEVDRTYGELAHYIAENGLANKFDGLSTDATEQEISDFLQGMDLSDVAQELQLDLSEAKIIGQENLAASIAETANNSVASMIENANAINEALEANGASGELTMNSDGSYSIKLTPEVDKSKLTEDVAEGTSDGYKKAAKESTSEGIKGQYEYGDTKTEWRQQEQLSSGGRPDFGEGVVVNNAKLTGEIDTSGVNPEIDAKVKPTEILTESFEDSGQTLEMPAEVSNIEVPKGDAETLNLNGKVDNIEVPDSAGKDVKLEGTIDNVEVPDDAGEAVQIEGDVNVSEVPEVQGTAHYEGEFPTEAPGVQGTADYNPGIFPTSAPTVYGTAVYSGDFPTSAPTISGTVVYSGSFPSGGGGGNYDGTAHYNGSAYSSGNWGVKQSQKALVGELGMETVVYGGRYWTVGDTGAEFANIPKGAIVFNHKQTEELFKNGHINTKGGRGTIAHANGTAYASGNAFASGSDPTDFDYAAIKIDRLNDDINLLADTMELFDKYAKQNALAQQEIGKIHEAILANEQAYNYYLSKANEVGLDEGHVEKIKNGTIEIEAIGDDDLKKKVDNYKKWYDAALNTQSAIVKLKKELQEISKIKLDNIEDEFQWWKDWRQAVLDRREATIDLYKEQHGHDSVGRLQDSARHYTAFISELEDRMSQLQKEINAQVASGELQKYSKAWYEATQRCVEARTEIIELQLKLEEINNTIREANWNNFNKMLDNFASLRNEMDTAYDFVGDMNPFRDDASVNANGKAQLAMLQDGLINARQEVKNYSVAYNALNKELKKGIISQDEYDEKLQDLRKDQLDAAQSVKKYRDAILDLVRDGIEKETEVFEKLISVRQENLKKQKEADDYARTVRDKTKDINDIQAQITALSGDDSIATRAQIRELEAKLQEAQQDLDDTRRDHEYDVMSKAYDKELNDFKDIQEQKLKDLDTYLDSQEAAIKDALTIIRDEYQATYRRMDNIAKLYGITLNDSILNPWVSAKKAVQEYNKAIAKPKKATVKIKTGNYVKTTKKKARGTYNASSGLTLTDEDGTEAILTKDGVLRQLDSGDTVFNARQREMLWKISKMSPSALIKPSISANLSSGNGGMNGDININYDITIEGNATESTVADIDEVCKRAAEYTKNDMVKSFRKIGIAI